MRPQANYRNKRNVRSKEHYKLLPFKMDLQFSLAQPKAIGEKGRFKRQTKRQNKVARDTYRTGDQLLDSLVDHLDYLRSDHVRFWFTGQKDIPSLKAVLLTDTG